MAQLLWSSFGVEAHRRTLETPPDCSRRRNRLCENSSPAGDPGKTTSTVSIWRVFFGGEGSENPFFVLPKCHFGVFAQPGEEADAVRSGREIRLLTSAATISAIIDTAAQRFDALK